MEPEISPCSGLGLLPAMSGRLSSRGKPGPPISTSTSPSSPSRQLGDAQRLVRGESRLLQRVGERIVADVVEQGRDPNRHAVFVAHGAELAPLLQRGERARVRW